MVTAIIVAAGRGVRMGLKVKKQYAPVLGKPLLCHTLSAFARHPEIASIVLAAPSEDFSFLQETLLPQVVPQRPVILAPGGAERQDSVFSGLCRVPEGTEIVVVHDGVRPFASGHVISACIAAAREHGAAIAAVPASDTLKQADGNGFVEKTLDRSYVWLTQTPQAFRLSVLLAAHNTAKTRGIRATDDAALVEAVGGRVKIVTGSRENLKVTTPEDLILARALLEHREKG